MKKTLSTLLLIWLCTTIHAEHHYLLSGWLADDSDHYYSANSHIILSSGFFSEPHDGHEVMLAIDPMEVSPSEQGITGGLLPNQDGVVGAIDGVIDIGLLGGASYTIPIEVPAGLCEMKPQLAISYNSQGKNGLMGWGWDLVGISSIARVGANLYYDGFTSPINDGNDRFVLNGQRLMKVSSGNYGGQQTTYRTEQDQLSNIVSYLEPNIKGPASFHVYNADGNTFYYGTTDDSRALMTSDKQINLWLLKQIKDRYGNEITYHYLNEEDEYLLERIDYSGNSSQQLPAAFSVAFQYTNRDDVNLSFYGSQPYRKKHLLSNIVIKHGESILYQYRFDYQQPIPQNGYPYNLLKEIVFCSGNQHYNPTTIQWGANNYHINSSADVKYNVITTGIENAFINAIKFSGDFNGDGYSDVISVKPDDEGTFTTAELFLNKGVGNAVRFEHVNTFSLDPRISWINIADCDGDGRDDIIFVKRTRNSFPLPDVIEAEVHLCKINSQGIFCFRHHNLPDCPIPRNTIDALMIGDFLGEGKQSILLQSTENSDQNHQISYYYTYDPTTEVFLLSLIPSPSNIDRFFPADYDGDGITEILYQDSDNDTHIIKLHCIDNVFCFHETSLCHPTDWDDCFPGDYNGDGLIDLLFYKAGEDRPWRVFYSSSVGISDVSLPLPDNFPYSTPGNYHYSLDNPHSTSHYLKIGDFDGNGCDDIALFHDNLFYAFYGPLNNDDGTSHFSYTHQISTQQFNLYDNKGVCIGNFLGKDNLSFLGHVTLSHLPPLSLRQEVQCITDGMGRKTEFTYDYLIPNPEQPSEEEFYQLHTNLTDQTLGIYPTPLPIRALQSVTTYNMKNKPITTRCRYEGALIHHQGKGFLGFSRTRQDDYCNHQLQKKIIKSYDIASFHDIIHPVLEEEWVYDGNGHLQAHSEYDNQYYLNRNNAKVFVHLADKTAEEYNLYHPDQFLKKKIKSTTIHTDCNEPFYYNDFLQITEAIVGTTNQAAITNANLCEYQTQTLYEYMENLPDEWLINRIKSNTTVIHHEGETDLMSRCDYTYDNEKPFQIRSITETPYERDQPDLRLTRRIAYEYDTFGNRTAQTISAPHSTLPSRRELFEFSEEYGHLLLTRHINSAVEETTYRYHPDYLYCTRVTDCNGLETHFEQDPLGVTQTTRNPDGTLICKTIRWANDGYAIWEKKTGQSSKLTFHYKTGDPYMSHSYDINGDLLVSNIEYDNLGRVETTEIPHPVAQNAQSIQYHYDPHNEIRQIIHTDGSYEDIKRNGNETCTVRHGCNGASQCDTKITNVMGWIIRSIDNDGTSVINDYYPDGKLKWSQIEGHDETRIEMAYDGLRNRTMLYDPNYGQTINEYNAYGEMTLNVTPKHDTTTYEYDRLGNLVRRTENDHDSNIPRITEWNYSQEDGQLGLLTGINAERQTIRYDYDTLTRLQGIHEYRSGTEYLTRYLYDEASRIESIIYPTRFVAHYRYTCEGDLRSVLDDSMKRLWHTNETSNLNQPTKVTTGDGMVTTYSYDPKSQRLIALRSVLGEKALQEYHYDYDDFSNLTERNDLVLGNLEKFTYDPLNRLTSASNPEGTSLFTYDALGRMTSKSNAGNLLFSEADYSGPKPHAIKAASTHEGVFPQERMDIKYTAFDKVSSITEGLNSVSFEYGYDHQRISVTEHLEGKTRQKHYVNQCEFIVHPNHDTIARTFFNGPNGVFAVAETKKGHTTLHYIHKDHLDSWTLITDQHGNVEQENRFDAWGNSTIKGDLLFDRGFTGHEHIRGMKLINMNGRVYDPVTSSMLSPDNNIQLPDFTQNFNRYSYCMNNPLSFTDPDGNYVIDKIALFYLLFCTDVGYEFQKHYSFAAAHLDIHLSKQQLGLGLDVSLGVPQKMSVSYRVHFGATYYWALYDNSYQGWEFRAGGEWSILDVVSFSGTKYYSGTMSQTTNSIIIGDFFCNIAYQNDYMFNLGYYMPGIPAADNGDRYRSAAARFMIGPIEFGVNLFTGDPGLNHEDRRTFEDPEANGRETYTINENGDDPDRYRAGIAYVGVGPIRAGVNSESIRNFFQNRFAHDFLCRGDSPYFKVLDRPSQGYFYFGTGTGSDLW